MKKILITEKQLNELTDSMFSFDENEIIKKLLIYIIYQKNIKILPYNMYNI